MSDTNYDRHAAGAARLAKIIGLIPADHPQLWTRDRIITRGAEAIRESAGCSWEVACLRAERVYDGWYTPSELERVGR
jgi:hypothetical protein